MAANISTSTLILIVDDSAVFRKVVTKELNVLGFRNVEEVPSARAALEALKTPGKDHGLLICDIHMPEMSGTELITVLRADDRFKNLPVLVVSSESDKAVITKAVVAGANGYASKPLTQESLARAFAQMAEKLKTSG